MGTSDHADPTLGETRQDSGQGSVGPGLLLQGRYRIDSELGRGGIGAVYLARDEQLEGRRVVVKVLLDTTSGSVWLQRKFQDEMRALARLDHPGIVGVLDVGKAPDGKPYLVMQYVPGRTLRSALKERGRLPATEAAEIVRQAAAALTAAHERGVYHRDLKPENILLQDLGHGESQVKLIDFGIATVKESAESETAMTQVAGTVLYMAPEQLAGRPSASSDVFALGVIAHELLTGQLPFRPSSPYELLPMQKAGLPRRPSAVEPALPAACDAVLAQALAFDPRGRPATARAFAEALGTALNASAPGGSAATVLVPRRPGAPVRQSGPGGRLVLAGVLLAAAVAGTLILRRSSGPAPAPAPATVPPAAAPAVVRELSYAVLVQRYRDGRPYRDAFRLPGAVLFGVDDRIRLLVSSPQRGHLYVLNEGPAAGSKEDTLNILFPSPTANAGSSALEAGRELSIPAESWFAFDEAQGTERLWLAWSSDPVPELEAVTGFANPRDRGQIRDPEKLAAVRALMNRQARAPLAAERDEAGQRTRWRAGGTVLLARLDLEHR